MPELSDWTGLVTARTDDHDELSVKAFASQASGSWSGTFKVIADDNQEYYVKALELCQAGGSSLAIERVVGRVGKLVGAPTCDALLIRIPDALAGWEARPGKPVAAGLAHAVPALKHCDEAGRPHLAARSQDDNKNRHAGVYAIYDWCMGNDPQWLYDIDADRTLYSHDHGLYLPPVGSGNLDQAGMVAAVNTPNELPDSVVGVLPAAIEAVADALVSVSRASLVDVLNSVPSSWPVTNETLETLGWFLESRAPAVAQRLRARV